MQITLSSQQSKILETLSKQGGYASLEDAIDTALVLLADAIVQQTPEQTLDETPDYLAWVEQTRLKLDAGLQAADRGEVFTAEEVLERLRRKIETAKATSL